MLLWRSLRHYESQDYEPLYSHIHLSHFGAARNGSAHKMRTKIMKKRLATLRASNRIAHFGNGTHSAASGTLSLSRLLLLWDEITCPSSPRPKTKQKINHFLFGSSFSGSCVLRLPKTTRNQCCIFARVHAQCSWITIRSYLCQMTAIRSKHGRKAKLCDGSEPGKKIIWLMRSGVGGQRAGAKP